MSDELFDPASYYVPGEPRRPVTALKAIHDRGAEMLARFLPEGATAVYRARAAKVWPGTWEQQVTVRVRTAGHRVAAEWKGLQHGDIDFLAYGILESPDAGAELLTYAILHGPELAEDITRRPGCLVQTAPGKGVLHHAPGGAEFYVVDLRHLRPETCYRATLRVGSDPAPLVEQDALW